MKEQETPPLTGPSELGDRRSRSRSRPTSSRRTAARSRLVTVSAFDSNGKPLRNLSLRSEIMVGGVIADFGSLSARNIVTGTDGRATLVYTAPAAPAGPAVDNGTTVSIAVTPIGTDFANSAPRIATIRLVPPGSRRSAGRPAAGVHLHAAERRRITRLCSSTRSSSKAPANNPIVSYSWNFGDGKTGSGMTQTHAFDLGGTYVVRLTVTDSFNRSASASQTVIIGTGNTPSAGTISRVADADPGEGDNECERDQLQARRRAARSAHTTGTSATARSRRPRRPTTTHDWQAAGIYTLTLTVTDDAGGRSRRTRPSPFSREPLTGG